MVVNRISMDRRYAFGSFTEKAEMMREIACNALDADNAGETLLEQHKAELVAKNAEIERMKHFESWHREAEVQRQANIVSQLKRRGYEPGQLQLRYRQGTPPKFEYFEVELALLDALMQGSIYGWSGDGSGMATQIVSAYAHTAEREEKRANANAALVAVLLGRIKAASNEHLIGCTSGCSEWQCAGCWLTACLSLTTDAAVKRVARLERVYEAAILDLDTRYYEQPAETVTERALDSACRAVTELDADKQRGRPALGR